ncbi:hypothetical protein J2Y69_002179 [Microbacterium resistens]|uniref:DNA modification methylase n=1 Tax=Microbacterium resistens TaxID=156977 RepID=A0ABU1SD88_9MICO|nr:DNA modification methylase [Microbacterium resistens]MDR6867575.1 hypothetical protein [Microbacterium resistens]
MKSRLAASLAITAAVIVGTSGCAMIAPQATTIQYSASDGVNVSGSGPVVVRNAFIVANEEGTAGNLVAGLVNESDKGVTLTVQAEGVPSQTLDLGAGKTMSLGGDEHKPLRLDGTDFTPGATVGVYFQSDDEKGVLAQVPVLDGTLPYYAGLVPSKSAPPTPTPTATPSSTTAPTPAPTETPAP